MKYFLLLLIIAGAASAQAPKSDQLLPPLPPWHAGSLGLIATADDPWITPSERSGLTETPPYEQTMRYLRRLVKASSQLKLVSIGSSDEGREIWMVVASAEGSKSPRQLRKNKKPTLLVQAGIHAGEIDGKDAGLMLLRDLTVSRRSSLLEQANLLFVPILNVDGHERFTEHGRMNQRGPVKMGWRTNARNRNLNRDYSKLETPGVRAIVTVLDQWKPDLYLDVHVTDGVDYQYDVTFGFNGPHSWSPDIAEVLQKKFEPNAYAALTRHGHVPGPLIFALNEVDYSEGISLWTASPRYSNGYGDARHVPTILVENHSLKPYLQRVLGTYVLLHSMLENLAEHHSALAEAINVDRQRRRDRITLGWREQQQGLPELLLLKGIKSYREYSSVSGAAVVRWNGEPELVSVAVRAQTEPKAIVKRPAYYYIPAAWSPIAVKLKQHGIRVDPVAGKNLDKPVQVLHYRLPQAAIASGVNPFEGRLRVDPGQLQQQVGEMQLKSGDYMVSTDQALGTLAVLLLEPQSPDSFFQWGYFLEIMNRTEYFENYVAEPLAQAMLHADDQLAARFAERLKSDASFAADPEARLRWFYEQSPYYDQEYLRYPIARSVE